MAELQESLHFLDYWRVIRARKEIVIAVFLLVVLTGILITCLMPRVYKASAIIAVKEEKPDVDVFSTRTRLYDPLFLRTQFEIIQSRPVIVEAIRRLNLNEKLAKAYGYDNLPPDKIFEQTFLRVSKKMKVQQYRDTNLIEIQIFMDEPKATAPHEAAETANMIAEVFRDQTIKRSREAIERALNALYESLQERRSKVTNAEKKVEKIRQRYQLDIFRDKAGTDSSLDKLSLARLESERITARIELADKEARYKKIYSLPPDKLLDAAPRLVGDIALTGLVAAKRKSEVSLSDLRETYGPRHPDVVRIEAVIKELDKKTKDALEGLKIGVQADYEAVKAKLHILETELEERKEKERNAEAGGYAEFEKAREELELLRKIRDVLELRYEEEKIEMRIPRTIVEFIERATPPDQNAPDSPKATLNIIVSLMLGMFSGVGLAFFIEYLDTSVKTIEDIERLMGVPVLGVIPQKVKPFVDKTSAVTHAEAYRVLRTNMQFSKKLEGGKTICFTSGSVGEGKTLTLFNLAHVCSRLGDRILIVDSDMHRPKQHRIMGMSNTVGLVNVLIGEANLEDCIMDTGMDNLYFLACGKLSSSTQTVHGLLNTVKMRELVKDLRESFDYVFFDAPPILGVSDTSLLVRETDGVLLIIQHRKYPKSVSNRAKSTIESLGANLIGVVLNNINISRDYSAYYYHYYTYPQGYRT